MFSNLIENLQASPTLALAAQAKKLKKEGADVLSLTVGEPDWNTFDSVKQAAVKAINEDFTRYTPASGIQELRAAVADNTNKLLSTSYTFKNVSVTAGAKFALFASIFSLVNPDDEVLIPSPYWVSYPAMVDLSRGKSVLMKTGIESDFKIQAQQLEKVISKRTKLLMLNSPSNPTGSVYSLDELKALSEVLLKHPQVFILCDDIYNQLNFDDALRAPHLLDVCPKLIDRVIIVNGASKVYAMTGWRMGWVVGPEALSSNVAKFASQAMGSSNSVAQKALLNALNHCDDEIVSVKKKLIDRQKKYSKILESVSQWKLFEPKGAFYFWVSMESILNKKYKGNLISSSSEYCKLLLEDFSVALVPGDAFGAPEYLRLSFAVDENTFSKAISRICEFHRLIT